MDNLMQYPWPGNIRELQNFIERAVILTKSNVLERLNYAEVRYSFQPSSVWPSQCHQRKLRTQLL
jgi:DNA-binding NtrC family response regulator